jgi:hypothetical protein
VAVSPETRQLVHPTGVKYPRFSEVGGLWVVHVLKVAPLKTRGVGYCQHRCKKGVLVSA